MERKEEIEEMVTNTLNNKSYTEILEIIKYLPLNEYKKIPKEQIEFYENNKDPLYKFQYNPSKPLNEQNVLRETKALIVMLFRDALATETQKEKLKNILEQNERIYQKKQREKYNPDKIFKNKLNTLNLQTQTKTENVQMVKYKENPIKKLFKNILEKLQLLSKKK